MKWQKGNGKIKYEFELSPELQRHLQKYAQTLRISRFFMVILVLS